MSARPGFPVVEQERTDAAARAGAQRSLDTIALHDRVQVLVRSVYGSEARVDLIRGSHGWEAQVRTSPSRYVWSLFGRGPDRAIVLRKIEASLVAMVAGTSRCRYCPRSIPAAYDGRRPCISRPIASSNRRHPCVP